MKKLGLIAALFLMASSAHAQSVGVLGGASFWNRTAGDNDKVNTKAGFMAGLSFDLPFIPLFNLELDGIYHDRRTESAGTTTSIKEIQIPLFARFQVLPFVNVGVGPYVGFGVGKAGVDNGTGHYDFDFSDRGYKKTDFGGIVSGQVTLPSVGTSHFILDARYAFGLTNLANDYHDWHTRDFEILGGFRWAM